ncbi:hypothetical protein, unlikely [Trypanosoma brucei brucei TREU927]|uniref:Uncharacterized protein n=1 Tax=Trypanosoma brucei brucei (strain 927/4 GUTat10.1) TaxID=185431 RepID=Q4GZ73_TRYB2|nr:hypothetical protein, unlikely [Trypanosoma brucei brucei TREU927]CAJ16118.1 hypothetical protein, unlikely [Trypanosoma brucei brucei TREU927]
MSLSLSPSLFVSLFYVHFFNSFLLSLSLFFFVKKLCPFRLTTQFSVVFHCIAFTFDGVSRKGSETHKKTKEKGKVKQKKRVKGSYLFIFILSSVRICRPRDIRRLFLCARFWLLVSYPVGSVQWRGCAKKFKEEEEEEGKEKEEKKNKRSKNKNKKEKEEERKGERGAAHLHFYSIAFAL